jgi:hypothetical protein
MGSVRKTKAGTFEARWRDAADRQCCKTFATKREASAFVAEVEASLSRGTYVDPHVLDGGARVAADRPIVPWCAPDSGLPRSTSWWCAVPSPSTLNPSHFERRR